MFDREIVPGAMYEVQAIGEGCHLGHEENYSDPLVITTSKWGDVMGYDPTLPPPYYAAPDGSVSILDVTARR